MQPASAEGSNSDTGRALRRYGPIAAIAVTALVVIGIVLAGGGDDAEAPLVSDDTTERDAPEDTAATTDTQTAAAESDTGTPDTGASDTEAPSGTSAMMSRAAWATGWSGAQ